MKVFQSFRWAQGSNSDSAAWWHLATFSDECYIHAWAMTVRHLLWSHPDIVCEHTVLGHCKTVKKNAPGAGMLTTFWLDALTYRCLNWVDGHTATKNNTHILTHFNLMRWHLDVWSGLIGRCHRDQSQRSVQRQNILGTGSQSFQKLEATSRLLKCWHTFLSSDMSVYVWIKYVCVMCLCVPHSYQVICNLHIPVKWCAT